MKKIFLFTLFIFFTLVLLGFSYAYIMGKAMQKMPYVALPKELKLLENEINIQLQNNEGEFQEIPVFDVKNCQITLKLYIDNDSIAENNINRYLKKLVIL